MTGRLYYVIGASGVGKDSLLNYARTKCNGKHHVIFAHRYITRPVDGSENYVSLTHEEFKERNEANLFALDWASHGNYYGIGIEIDQWMNKGFKVVVNGSREYLPESKTKYPDLVAVVIEASREIIRQRLLLRGRETKTEIENRMARSKSINVEYENALVINNDGEISDAGGKLVDVILGKR